MSCYNSRCQEKSQGNPAKMFMPSKFKLQQYGNGNDQVEIRWEMDSSVLHTSISEPSSPLFQSLSHLLLPLEFKESPQDVLFMEEGSCWWGLCDFPCPGGAAKSRS